MFGAQLGNDPGSIEAEYLGFALVLAALYAFGYWYDGVINEAHKSDELTPYVALYVVGGVAVTLIGMGIVSLILPQLNALVIGLPCFAASGLRMVRGSMRRFASTISYTKSKYRRGGE